MNKRNLHINIDRKKINACRILCIGDIMLDHYIFGRIERFSPEAPIPVLLYENEKYNLGGVGNVAKNLCDIGANCILLSLIGTDFNAKKITQLLNDEKKLKSEVLSIKNFKTTLKKRYINNSRHLLRVDDENYSFKKNAKLKEKLDKILKKNIKECDVIILSDYNKGFLDRKLIKQVVKIAKKNDKLIIADPKKNDLSYYAGVNILTPNQKEISDLSRKNLKSEKDIISFSRIMMKKYKIDEILVTRSSKGMLLIGQDYIRKILATSKKVKDVTGAGDTVICILALMKALGMSSIDASNVANVAAGITIGKAGTASLSYSELIKNNVFK